MNWRHNRGDNFSLYPLRSPGIVTERRKNNLFNAFSWICWDMNSLEIIKMGFGDRPAFRIEGFYRSIKLIYTSPYPSGCQPGKIKFYYPNKNRWIMFKSKSSLCDSNQIKEKVDLIIDNYFKIQKELEDRDKKSYSNSIGPLTFKYDIYDIKNNKLIFNKRIRTCSRYEFLELINRWNRSECGEKVYIAKGE